MSPLFYVLHKDWACVGGRGTGGEAQITRAVTICCLFSCSGPAVHSVTWVPAGNKPLPKRRPLCETTWRMFVTACWFRTYFLPVAQSVGLVMDSNILRSKPGLAQSQPVPSLRQGFSQGQRFYLGAVSEWPGQGQLTSHLLTYIHNYGKYPIFCQRDRHVYTICISEKSKRTIQWASLCQPNQLVLYRIMTREDWTLKKRFLDYVRTPLGCHPETSGRRCIIAAGPAVLRLSTHITHWVGGDTGRHSRFVVDLGL